MAPQPPKQEDDDIFDELNGYNRLYAYGVLIIVFVAITITCYKD
jgi:hypothetical protein